MATDKFYIVHLEGDTALRIRADVLQVTATPRPNNNWVPIPGPKHPVNALGTGSNKLTFRLHSPPTMVAEIDVGYVQAVFAEEVDPDKYIQLVQVWGN